MITILNKIIRQTQIMIIASLPLLNVEAIKRVTKTHKLTKRKYHTGIITEKSSGEERIVAYIALQIK